MSVTIRNYRDEDLQAVVEVINAADSVDQLDEGTSVAQLRERLGQPDFDPYRDAFVATDEDARVVGHARLELDTGPEQSFFYTTPTVHPDWREQGIERQLLERLWKRAHERRRDLRSSRVYFHAYCAVHQTMTVALFESFGLRPMRYSPHMVCQPLENLAQPQLPPGIEVRPYVQGQDDQSALKTLNEAFADDWEFVPTTMETLTYWTASSTFRAELSRVALDGDEVIGLCLCTVSEDRFKRLGRRDGYVNVLAVRPPYGRRGLGSALLLTCLHALKRAGMESATLDTDIDNPTQAMSLYERVGFREVWRWVSYGREIQ